MVPSDFTSYFTAVAAGAGVLLGLLFVAVSLRTETIFGEAAPPMGRAQAGAAFIGLVNCFFVALVALIPQAGLAGVSITLAVISTLATIRLHRTLARHELHLTMLVLGLGSYLFQLVIGIGLDLHPKSLTLVDCAAFLMIAQISVALSRAWGLVQGQHMAGSRTAPAGPDGRSASLSGTTADAD